MGKKKYKIIDLFAGIGGIRIGFEKAECISVFASEWDKHSQDTYMANFSEKPRGDITKIKVSNIPDFDILTAGFPCQPFSSIGRREGFRHPTQGTLFHDIVRILRYHTPPAFLLENVSGLRSHDKKRTFITIMDSLDRLGYEVFEKTLNAADFNVPQERKRIYIVGFAKELGSRNKINFQFPNRNKKRIGIGKFIETDIIDRSISKHLQKQYLFKKDDGRPQIIDRTSDFPVNTLVSTYHKIQRLTGIFVKDGPTGLRLLSENECKAIMGFKKSFKVPVSRTQMYRQFGNSVAVPVISAIAKRMTDRLDKLM